MIIISNTSPISNLAAIGQLTLLQQLYGKVIIPQAVYQEILASGSTDPVKSSLFPLSTSEFNFVRLLSRKL